MEGAVHVDATARKKPTVYLWLRATLMKYNCTMKHFEVQVTGGSEKETDERHAQKDVCHVSDSAEAGTQRVSF